jgi:FixJ family two-component response regulator
MSQVLIAIVDDDEAVRDSMESLMLSLGYNASTFGSAEEFLNSKKIRDTSCIISDVQMPGMGGIDLHGHLVARGHCVPIIFMTGHPDDSKGARAMKAGAIGFLSKPFMVDHLIGCIEKALKTT